MFRPTIALAVGTMHLVAALAAVASVIALAGSAHADATKCKAAIIKAGAGFVQATTKALQTCEASVVKGKLPPGTDCHANAKAAAALAKGTTKLRTAVVKACAGKDKTCGTADDASLAAIGWDITTCPNFEHGSCTTAITSCSDIPTCLACISEAAVDQAITLYYGALAPTDPKSKDKTVQVAEQVPGHDRQGRDHVPHGQIQGPRQVLGHREQGRYGHLPRRACGRRHCEGRSEEGRRHQEGVPGSGQDLRHGG